MSMAPFRGILHLAVGDILGKGLSFVAFVFLARSLGVVDYGVLEFAVAILAYLLLLADGGIEVWATRQAARAVAVRALVAAVVPARLVLGLAAFGVLLLLLPALPAYPGLTPLLLLFGMTFVSHALSLKWACLGRERMALVGCGVALGHLVFAVGVALTVRGPGDVLWVPVARVAGDLVTAAWFFRLFVAEYGFPRSVDLRRLPATLRAAASLGTIQALGLLNLNADSLILGILLGPVAVGAYGAAYKPVYAMFGVAITYFSGLLPILSRTYDADRNEFGLLVARSLRLTAAAALPLGAASWFLAEPLVLLLFGAAYAEAVPVLILLSWSATFVILRGTYRSGLNAAGWQRLDLRAALVAVALNVGLNLVLIPRFGLLGAATATVAADGIWLVLAWFSFNRRVMAVSLLAPLARPLAATAVMTVVLALGQALPWVLQASLGATGYVACLLRLETDVRSWLVAHGDAMLAQTRLRL